MELLRSQQSPQVANQNLSILKNFAAWTIERDLMSLKLFASLKVVKAVRRVNPKRQPLTVEQTRAVLKAFKSHPHYHSYHDFVMTLAYLGARVSEVAGLRWKDIDWKARRVCIAESLSRGEDGRTSGYARQRKATKNTKIRWVDLHSDLYAMLQERRQAQHKPNDLIFLSQQGKPIDDHSFSQRAWKVICKQVGIDRVPYSLRHSLGSHMLENGATDAQVADVLGNTPETVNRHYAHTINRPQMPGF